MDEQRGGESDEDKCKFDLSMLLYCRKMMRFIRHKLYLNMYENAINDTSDKSVTIARMAALASENQKLHIKRESVDETDTHLKAATSFDPSFSLCVLRIVYSQVYSSLTVCHSVCVCICVHISTRSDCESMVC